VCVCVCVCVCVRKLRGALRETYRSKVASASVSLSFTGRLSVTKPAKLRSRSVTSMSPALMKKTVTECVRAHRCFYSSEDVFNFTLVLV